MSTILILIAALAPVAVLFYYIYHKDKSQPEPTKWLVKSFIYGAISVFVALIFVGVICVLTGIDSDLQQHSSIIEAMIDSFFTAAIPEELAKLFMMWLLLRKNPYYDEHFDGIVYAACIGLGFAGLENVMYLFQEEEDVISLAVQRALFSVPGHFFFACLMGYFYSLNHFGINRSFLTKSLIIVAPVLAHGLYDGILFASDINEWVSLLCMVLFLFFFNRLRKIGVNKINTLLDTDKIR